LAHVVNLGALAIHYCYLDFHAAADAVWRQQGPVVRQISREASEQPTEAGHV
jgi:hypothetical protein